MRCTRFSWFALALYAFFSSPSYAERVVLYHTSDVHGWYASRSVPGVAPGTFKTAGGYAALASLVARERGPFALLDSGDTYFGTPEGVFSKGTASIELMNALGYAAMTIGNREYDFGEENLKRLSSIARFPMLAANARVKDARQRPSYLKPYVVLEIGGKKIGVLGLANAKTPSSLKSHVERLDFKDEIAEAKELVPEMRRQGVDAVVVLVHGGMDSSFLLKRLTLSTPPTPATGNLALARAVPGIDVILGGHNHTGLEQGFRDPVSATLLVESYHQLLATSRVELEFDDSSGRLTSASSRLIDLDTSQTGEEPAILKIVKRYQEQVPEKRGQGGHLFRAGAATSNITPEIGGEIVGGWRPIVSTHVHDELFVRCLVLDNGETRLAIAVSDSVGIARGVYEEAKRLAHAETGIPVANILTSATHTHSATSARGKTGFELGGPLDEYQHFVARRIADAVRRATNNLEPARVGWAVGRESRPVFNRRYRMKPGVVSYNPFGGQDQVRMNPGIGNPDVLEPAGPVDPELPFIAVQALDGRPIAVLANYSLHYVGGTRETDISGDYYGVFAQEMERLVSARYQDPPFVAIMSNGTSANINNIDVSGKPARYPPYAKMRIVASQIAAEVFKNYQEVAYYDWVTLGAAAKDLRVGLRVPGDKDLAWARAILSRPETEPERAPRERIYAQRTIAMADYPAELDIPVQALRIGDLGVAAIPTEVFVEIGLELKQRSPFRPSFAISLANGAYGYLPTPEQHRLGGYETWRGTSRLEIDASTKIVDTLLELFEGLR